MSIGKYERDVETPHLMLPSSGSSSSASILKSIVMVCSDSPMKATLSVRLRVKETLFRSFTPSTVLDMPLTLRTSFPSSLSILKPMKGYFLDEAGISSTVSLSRSFLLAVACLDFDLFAEKRLMNSWSSLIFSSAFLFWFFIILCMSCEDSYQNS